MKKGDKQAFAELYERREPALYRYALHMTSNAASAEEIAQEVFVQLMAANTRFDETRGSLEGWMYGVARNLIRVLPAAKGRARFPASRSSRCSTTIFWVP